MKRDVAVDSAFESLRIKIESASNFARSLVDRGILFDALNLKYPDGYQFKSFGYILTVGIGCSEGLLYDVWRVKRGPMDDYD